jgi:hypothetical protein
MTENVLLIAGGSDPAGSELDGTEDSIFNRQNSFGNLLAQKLNYKPVNIAISGSANTGIVRSIIEWFDNEYKLGDNIFVLVGFADSIRMEAPWHRPTWHDKNNPHVDWFSKTSVDYMRITPALKKYNDDEDLIEDYQRFMACGESFLQIYCANLILQLQYFLKTKKVPYLLCNTLYMFDKNLKQLEWYFNQFDKERYINFDNNDEAFYTRYANQGYKNPLAKYFHHGPEPHKLYADYLFEYINEKKLLELK